MGLLETPFGSFKLERVPTTTKGDLRAWDAADELLLLTLFKDYSDLLTATNSILIINDSFGALSIALNEKKVHCWSDSHISKLATEKNISLNNLSASPTFISSTEAPPEIYNVVILKIPKTTALLEDQLYTLKAHINSETIIIAGAMSKHIHTSTLKYFEKIIGTTTTSRATKKARLVFATNDTEVSSSSPYPKVINIPEYDLSLSNHANVFSQNQLDIGARFFIENLKKCPSANHIIDLGCGNGVLGIMAQRIQEQAKISFIDESYMAVHSSKTNYSLNVSSSTNIPKPAFIVSDSFNQYNNNKADLILCNPPFHQAHSVGDHIAWEMFTQSKTQLNKDGEIWVIGNRHLRYHIKLKKLFGNCRTVASNKKFVLLASQKMGS